MAPPNPPTSDVLPLPIAEVVLPEGHPQAGETLAIVAHVVTHRDGVLLFDTGVGEGNAEIEELFRPRRVPLEDALGAHGISMADVTAVANCHLHFDHSGQNARFPGLPIYAQRAEHAMIHAPGYTIAEWVDFAGATFELLDGEAEVAPGVRLIPTPGHSPGHQSLVVDTGNETVVVAGQALLTKAEWEGVSDPAVSGERGSWDEATYRASVRALLGLDPGRVHFAHDPAVWQRPTGV
jgi:N-acyl homoserine lactone hydrolase